MLWSCGDFGAGDEEEAERLRREYAEFQNGRSKATSQSGVQNARTASQCSGPISLGALNF